MSSRSELHTSHQQHDWEKNGFRGLVYLVMVSPWKEMKHCSVPFLTQWYMLHKAAFGGEREGGGGRWWSRWSVDSLTMWLCWDWVEPYIVIPLVGGANCGTSASTKPRLSMRLMREKPRAWLPSANITQQRSLSSTIRQHNAPTGPTRFNQEGRKRSSWSRCGSADDQTKERNETDFGGMNKRALSL